MVPILNTPYSLVLFPGGDPLTTSTHDTHTPAEQGSRNVGVRSTLNVLVRNTTNHPPPRGSRIVSNDQTRLPVRSTLLLCDRRRIVPYNP
jgi:hypothetical protein